MLVLSTGAMVTGTVAWFTAVRQATVNFSSVQVQSSEGDLQVAYVAGPEAYTADTSVQGIIDLTGTEVVTDISGDGLAYYKPTWAIGNTIAAAINDVTSDIAGLPLTGYYVDFQLSLTNSNAATPIKVYLGENSVVTPVSVAEADVAAANSVRVAILDSTRTTRNLLWAPEIGDATYNYITPATAGTSLYTVDAFTLAPSSALLTSFINGPFTNYTGVSGEDHTGGNSPVLADLTTVDATIITVRVWIEGEDVDCTNTAKNGFFELTLDLYALGYQPA